MKGVSNWRQMGITGRIAALLLLFCAATVSAKNVALLIAVGQFHDPQLKTNQLLGPAHDIDALLPTLTGQWQFAASDIHTLRDAQATHEQILKEISALEQRSAPGDTLLIY